MENPRHDKKKHHLRAVYKSSGKGYGERKKLDMYASWIGNMEKGNEKVNGQKWELKTALTKSQK